MELYKYNKTEIRLNY